MYLSLLDMHSPHSQPTLNDANEGKSLDNKGSQPDACHLFLPTRHGALGRAANQEGGLCSLASLPSLPSSVPGQKLQASGKC